MTTKIRQRIILSLAIVLVGTFFVTTQQFYELQLQYKKIVMFRQNETFRENVWAHRVNSREKLQEAAKLFYGFEIDVVYDNVKNIFDVNHPPEKSINLSLKEFFSSYEDVSDGHFWIDLKNLGPHNSEQALQRLNFLIKYSHIKPFNIIVESNNPYQLQRFTVAGYKTSYYLPTIFVAKVANKKNGVLTREEKKDLGTIQDKIDLYNVDYISTHYKYYDFIDNFLNTDKGVLLWAYTLEHHKIFQLKKIKAILEYRGVHVLLIKFNTRHDR